MQNMKKLFKHQSRKFTITTFLILLICILGKTQIISVNLSSIQNPSIDATSNGNLAITPKLVGEVNKNGLYYNLLNATSTESLNNSPEQINGRIGNLASNPQIATAYSQYFVLTNEQLPNYGSLTLQTLASNEFYVNNSPSTKSNQTIVNNKTTSNILSNSSVISNSKTINPSYSSVLPITVPISNLNNTVMTQNQFNSLENQLTQVKQRATQVIVNGILPSTTNTNLQSPNKTPNSSINVAKDASNIFSVPIQGTNNSPADNSLIIQQFKNAVNSRFYSSFNSP